MTKIKETQRYFAIRKQNYAALVINKEYYCLFCYFRFLCRLFSLVGHGEQIVESNLIINNCRMFSR